MPSERKKDTAPRLLGLALTVIGGAWLALQSPRLQTGLAEAIIKKAEENLSGRISVGSVAIEPFNSFVIKDLLIIDEHPCISDGSVDTLFRAAEISGKVSPKTLFSGGGVHFSRVRLKEAYLHLTTEPDSARSSGVTSNLARFLRSKEPQTEGYAATADIFLIDKLYASRLRYRMSNFAVPFKKEEDVINWGDLDVVADLTAHSFKYTGGRMSGIVDSFSATEKSGYSIRSLTGRAVVGMGKATIEKIRLIDDWSDVSIPLYSMAWKDSREDFRDFLNKIRQELRISEGTLSMKTLHAFTGLPDIDLSLELGKTRAKGYISDLTIEKLLFKEPRSGVSGDISAILTGLPDIAHLLADAKINSLSFTPRGLQGLLGQFGVKADLSALPPYRTFSLSASAKGPLNNLAVRGGLGSRIGRADFNLQTRNLAGKAPKIGGRLSARGLDLGELLSQPDFGVLTAESGFSAVLTKGNPSVKIDSLLIDKFGFKGYEYTGIRAEGGLDGKVASGRLISADPNLNLSLEGSYDLGNGGFAANGNIAFADLQAMNFDKRGRSLISAGLEADFSDSRNGRLKIKELTLENELGQKRIGDISLNAFALAGSGSLTLHSDFADAEYFGNLSLADLPACLEEITLRRELSALYSKEKTQRRAPRPGGELAVNLHDTRDLLSFVMPGLYLADSTSLNLSISGSGDLSVKLNSSLAVWRSRYIKGAELSLDNLDGSLNAVLLGKEADLQAVGFSNAALTLYADNNSVFAGFSFDGTKGMDNLGEVYLTGDLSRDSEDKLCINAKPLSSFLRFDGKQWNIDESDISWSEGMAKIKGFRIYNGRQSLTVDGGISASSPDTLTVGVSNVDLSVINYFYKQKIDVRGRTSGTAVITSPLGGNMRALGYLACDSLTVGSTPAGSIRASAVWDSGADKVNLYLRNYVSGKEALSASGIYHPKEREAELTANLDKMNLLMAKPFLGKFVSEISGGLSGTVYAGGPIDSIKIESRGTSIDDARLRLVSTGVAYSLDGPFSIDNNGLIFNDIAINDDFSGSALLSGGISMRGFKEPVFDASARLYGLKLLENSGEIDIKGNLFANGSVYLSGPADALLLEADLETAGEGSVRIPMSGEGAAPDRNLLSFTSHEPPRTDPYEDILAELLKRRAAEQKKGSEFIARVRLTANTGTEAVLGLDNTGENLLRFRGNGVIGVNLRPAKDIFEVSGDYNISEGSYRFSVPGVNKDFSINPGSSISFGGDLLESKLDIGATYSLRTSLGRLLADTSSVSSRRQVNCGINISDRLAAPTVSFSIDVPDLDPGTKARVESALNTEDKIQKQFIALLVTGSFVPDEQSGIVNNPNILYSNVSEIMSRQLSDILARLEIPLDMGLGYQQNSGGTDLFDLAVSAQLFNNRVEVHGNVGNRKSLNGTQTNTYGDLVGDLDIDWKITPSGQLRLNAFSHSADDYSSYLDNTQRNGAGITYQKEFDTWGEFFRNLFRGKASRDSKAPERKEQKKVTVDE